VVSRSGVLAGLSAAVIAGTKWIERGLPAELIHTNRRAPPMLTGHTDGVQNGETRYVDGMLVTSAAAPRSTSAGASNSSRVSSVSTR
jgi:hypothetical protein